MTSVEIIQFNYSIIQFNAAEWSNFKQVNGIRKKLSEDFHYMLNKKFQNSGKDINCFLKCK